MNQHTNHGGDVLQRVQRLRQRIDGIKTRLVRMDAALSEHRRRQREAQAKLEAAGVDMTDPQRWLNEREAALAQRLAELDGELNQLVAEVPEVDSDA